MLITSGAVLSDFEADFGEPMVFGVFEPWVPHFEPIGGITMMNPSHQDMGRYCNFDQRSEK